MIISQNAPSPQKSNDDNGDDDGNGDDDNDDGGVLGSFVSALQ